MRRPVLLLLALAPAAVLAVPGPVAASSGPPPTQAYRCPSPDTTYARVLAGSPVEVAVRDVAATGTVRVTRTSPAPVAVVRKAQGPQTFTFRVPETTTLRVHGDSDPAGHSCGEGRQVLLEVVPRVSLFALRKGPRRYAFNAVVQPARGQDVALYRVEADGRRVLTARSRVDPDGVARVDRRFLGSGRFGFVAVVAPSEVARAGESAVRPTVVH